MKQRIAINTELIGSSDTNPKYYKFKVTLNDGSVIPAYGLDLQDALRRVKKDLVVNEMKQDIAQIRGIVIALLAIALVVTISFLL